MKIVWTILIVVGAIVAAGITFAVWCTSVVSSVADAFYDGGF